DRGSAHYFTRYGRHSSINPAAYAASLASTCICGHCGSAVRQPAQRRAPGFRLVAGRVGAANRHTDLNPKCIPFMRLGNGAGGSDRAGGGDPGSGEPGGFARHAHGRALPPGHKFPLKMVGARRPRSTAPEAPMRIILVATAVAAAMSLDPRASQAYEMP